MKNGITEIMTSGKAPGIITGGHADHESVYHKAPKAIKALENEPRFKHGPTRGASGISKHFGMPVDFIRSTWEKGNAKAFSWAVSVFLFLWQSNLLGGQITPGVNFVNGQLVQASDLNNLVGLATINSTFYLNQAVIAGAPLNSDYLLFYSPNLAEYYKITAGSALFNNTNLIGALSPKATPVNSDLILGYDSVGGTLVQMTVGALETNQINTNLAFSITNLPVVTNPTNGDLTFVWSKGTNSTDPAGGNPFLAAVPVQDLYPKTVIYSNLACGAVVGGYIINSNAIYQGQVPQLRVVLVRTNNAADSTGLLIGDEIPASAFYNTQTNAAFYWGSSGTNFFVSVNIGAGVGNTLLVPQRTAGISVGTIALEPTSPTNFNFKVYATYYPMSP